ncbi:MAG: hypothetical protein Q7T76_08955 [Ferruginibacter sp.]|nr:hypothetical protein [Ferruginibacter sp.]
MNTIKQIAVIECGDSSKLFQLSPVSQSQGYVVSKIYYQNEVPANVVNSNHPGAMVVNDKQAIIDDSLIDMVIVSSPSGEEMGIVGEMLKANKSTTIL